MTGITGEQARIVSYTCTAVAIVILITRLLLSRYQPKGLDASFFFCAVGLVAITARIATNHYTLAYGTANDVLLDGSAAGMDDAEKERIRIGSILSLITRILVMTFYWSQSALLLLFYTRIVYHIKWVRQLINACWVIVFCSWIATILCTFLECRPLSYYWEVDSGNHECVRAYAQLLLQCVSNVFIDIVLLIISAPLFLIKGKSLKEKVQLSLLILLGTFCTIVTCLRVAYIYGASSAQPTRSFWASIQVVVSAFVANAPMIYGSYKIMRRKDLPDPSSRSGVHSSRTEPYYRMGSVTSPKTPTESQKDINELGTIRSDHGILKTEAWSVHQADMDESDENNSTRTVTVHFEKHRSRR